MGDKFKLSYRKNIIINILKSLALYTNENYYKILLTNAKIY